ncbi:MAG: hypothetical protein E7276_05315 [Pseudobutyrivibrio sp.]|nr:hypothetical protein [Pseudobutyrivibrio sp.]
MIDNVKRIIIFVVYDFEGKVDLYLEKLLSENKNISDRLVVVVNGGIQDKGIEILTKYSNDVYFRKNNGFDGGAYKDVLINFVGIDAIKKYDELVLMNDTFYGPFYSWKIVFDEMKSEKCDYWGLTRSEEQCMSSHGLKSHIQGYFFCFRKNILDNTEFWDFWRKLPYASNHDEAVEEYEIGLNTWLQKRKYEGNSYLDICGGKALIERKTNPYRDELEDIIMSYKCPIIKRKAISFRSIKKVKNVEAFIRKSYKYDFDCVWENWIRYDMSDNNSTVSVEELKIFCESHNNIYIYGSGKMGNILMDIIESLGLGYKTNFVITSGETAENVFLIDEITLEELDGIIIGVGSEFMGDVYKIAIRKMNPKNIFIPNRRQRQEYSIK